MNDEQIKVKVNELYREMFFGLLDPEEDLPHQIMAPYLYLGSIGEAYDIDKLIAKNITNVLNVADLAQDAASVYAIHENKFKVNFLGLRCHDIDSYKIFTVFDQTYQFTKQAKESGQKVLVHCAAGVSRSPTVVCAYLMREYGWTAEKALRHAHQIRKCVSPNLGFMTQLFKYQIELGIQSTDEQRI